MRLLPILLFLFGCANYGETISVEEFESVIVGKWFNKNGWYESNHTAESTDSKYPEYWASYLYNFSESGELVTDSAPNDMIIVRDYEYRIEGNTLIAITKTPKKKGWGPDKLIWNDEIVGYDIEEQKYAIVRFTKNKLVLKPEGYKNNVYLSR